MLDPSIRPAVPEDAGAITKLVRSSVSELCHDDHGGDVDKIDGWLENKTEDRITAWITAPDLFVFVTSCSTGIAAAGCHRNDGVILMNYVSPFYRFQGLSDGMLACLEASIFTLGLSSARLVSTRTAIPFYERRGWRAYGKPIPYTGVIGQPMAKTLFDSGVKAAQGI